MLGTAWSEEGMDGWFSLAVGDEDLGRLRGDVMVLIMHRRICVEINGIS